MCEEAIYFANRGLWGVYGSIQLSPGKRLANNSKLITKGFVSLASFTKSSHRVFLQLSIKNLHIRKGASKSKKTGPRVSLTCEMLTTVSWTCNKIDYDFSLKTNLRKQKVRIVLRYQHVLDRSDYDQGILKIINDTSKFRPIKEDPTLSREGRLQRLLRKLKKVRMYLLYQIVMLYVSFFTKLKYKGEKNTLR